MNIDTSLESNINEKDSNHNNNSVVEQVVDATATVDLPKPLQQLPQQQESTKRARKVIDYKSIANGRGIQGKQYGMPEVSVASTPRKPRVERANSLEVAQHDRSEGLSEEILDVEGLEGSVGFHTGSERGGIAPEMNNNNTEEPSRMEEQEEDNEEGEGQQRIMEKKQARKEGTPKRRRRQQQSTQNERDLPANTTATAQIEMDIEQQEQEQLQSNGVISGMTQKYGQQITMSYQEQLQQISELLDTEKEHEMTRQEERTRKGETWRQQVKMQFELLSDSDGDNHLDDDNFNPEELSMKLANVNQGDAAVDAQINQMLRRDFLDKEQQDVEGDSSAGIPQTSSCNVNYQESKKALITQKRRNMFSQFSSSSLDTNNGKIFTSDKSTAASSALSLTEILRSTETMQPSKNSRRIESQLLRLSHAIEGPRLQDPLEQFLFKKFKVNKDQLLARPSQTVGYKPDDFRRIKKYRINPLNMPICGSNFDEAKKSLVPQYHAVFNDHSDTFNRLYNKPTIPRNSASKLAHLALSHNETNNNNNNKQTHSSPNDTAMDQIATSPLRLKVSHHESYQNWEQILLSQENQERMAHKKKKLEKLNKMLPEDKEKYMRLLCKKAWQQVVRNVFKIYRFAQQAHLDTEQNSRKYAILCSKEVRKQYGKSQRTQKDWQLRSKKMHREMIGYWRKRERELNEIKRRKEKLEAELKRREDEEKETMLQKKRLEFLMKQSDLYAHFMAQKLGIEMKDKTNPAIASVSGAQMEQEQQQQQQGMLEGQAVIEGNKGNNPLMFKGKEIVIDENEAAQKVTALINERRKELQKFDQNTALERHAIGTEEDRVFVNHSNEHTKATVSDLKEASKLDFSSVEFETLNSLVKAPEHFNGNLKEYQLKGLRWLDNLYEQGINGILADEMGLGKTIQAIALITHIASTKNIWGPFLVVAPSSTLYNWQQELKKFFPALKVLPYWGSMKQRKMIRKYFSAKSLGFRNAPFHLVITSYQLIVSDEKTFQRITWQYMILDEAQAIKNINSMRWKTLLSFNSRNKLLLTGTPIQNTMAELWALLHFIMPKLFDSHDQFQEWFSKDIEASSQDKSQLNQHQLERLHAILKPFMLRRVKKDVEHELGAKEEIQVMCEMTSRQQSFYDSIKAKLSLKDFFSIFESKQKVDTLMNLVMQFRKVCNHPELFERRGCRSPVLFSVNRIYTGHLPARLGELKHVSVSLTNPISYDLPKLIYDEMISTESKNQFIHRYLQPFSAKSIMEDIYGKKNTCMFSFIRLLDLPLDILEIYAATDSMYLQVILIHFFNYRIRRQYRHALAKGEEKDWQISLSSSSSSTRKHNLWWATQILQGQSDHYGSTHVSLGENSFDPFKKCSNVDQLGEMFSFKASKTLIYEPYPEDQKQQDDNSHCPARVISPVKLFCLIQKVIAPAIEVSCSSSRFQTYKHSLQYARVGRYLVNGSSTVTDYFKSQQFYKFNYVNIPSQTPANGGSLVDTSELSQGMIGYKHQESLSNIEVVDFTSLVADSAKLKYLDALLFRLKKEGHRVLIFCQMTRMLDILEDFMTRKKYKFFRLDGSCNISDRRDMVNDFQVNDKTFAFLLSTRAGGLGVTLTAADVVIFYDNDWNPTMDAQAMDRAHRIGQTKKVIVYRLVIRGSVEERILKRALQKQMVQSTVYSGGAFKADIWKPKEVMELLLDESELKETQMFMPKRIKAVGAASNNAGGSAGNGTSNPNGQNSKNSKKQNTQNQNNNKGERKSKRVSKKEAAAAIAAEKKDNNNQVDEEKMMNEEEEEQGEGFNGMEDEENIINDGDNNDEFGIDFENIMEEGAANGMNDDLDDAADDDD